MASIIDLDRKLSRAAECGRGIRFDAGDVALLVGIGLSDLLSKARNELLKERARCQTIRPQFIAEVNSGLATTVGETVRSEAQTSMSGTMTSKKDAQEALQRAQRILKAQR